MTVELCDIGDVRLRCGVLLRGVRIAYRTLGRLSPDASNAILVLHGYTSGPDMILPSSDTAEGAWDQLIGSGRAIDTERYLVICPNALGSAYGSTSAASIDPDTGRPYGAQFPPIAMEDIVATQHALLHRLGISTLVAVIGPSFGGLQAFQWAVSYPHAMAGIVPALAAPVVTGANPAGLLARLARDPAWHGGHYYGRGGLVETLTAMRIDTLRSYGIDSVLARSITDPAARDAALVASSRRWAEGFDANAMVVLLRAIAGFDVTAQLDRIKARVLYVLSATDPVFPASLAPAVMAQLAAAGVDASYFEIDGPDGHYASGTDADLWAPSLRAFLRELEPVSAGMI